MTPYTVILGVVAPDGLRAFKRRLIWSAGLPPAKIELISSTLTPFFPQAGRRALHIFLHLCPTVIWIPPLLRVVNLGLLVNLSLFDIVKE